VPDLNEGWAAAKDSACAEISGIMHLTQIEDVFHYDERILEQAKRDGVVPWNLLVPYNNGR
jgi:hypothetical protein